MSDFRASTRANKRCFVNFSVCWFSSGTVRFRRYRSWIQFYPNDLASMALSLPSFPICLFLWHFCTFAEMATASGRSWFFPETSIQPANWSRQPVPSKLDCICLLLLFEARLRCLTASPNCWWRRLQHADRILTVWCHFELLCWTSCHPPYLCGLASLAALHPACFCLRVKAKFFIQFLPKWREAR